MPVTTRDDARPVGGVGAVLEEGVTKTIRVGERARTATSMNKGVVSLASVAVRLAAERHDLTGATAVVVGAGEMGQVAAKRLASRVDRLLLVNRTTERAEALAETVVVDSTRPRDVPPADDDDTPADDASESVGEPGN